MKLDKSRVKRCVWQLGCYFAITAFLWLSSSVYASWKPDLTIESIKPSIAHPVAGTHVAITVTVVNKFRSAKAPATKLLVKVGGETKPKIFNVPPLAPGKHYSVKRNVYAGRPINLLITARVDPHNTMSESDENNNEKHFTLSFARAPEIHAAIKPVSPCTEKRLTRDNIDEINPAIFGNKVVWRRILPKSMQVVIDDLQSGKASLIASGGKCGEPKINRGKVVFSSYKHWISVYVKEFTGWSVEIYDIPSHKSRPLFVSGRTQREPAINDFRVVYIEEGNIILNDPNYRKITTNRSSANPEIFEDYIVWQDKHNGNWDIYMYDMSKVTTYRITRNSADQIAPAIYGNRIVWQDKRNGNWDIYMFDLSTNTERRITTNYAIQKNPAIYENFIVWQDNRNGNWDIYMFDLSINTEKRITINTEYHCRPAIYVNRIVWQDKRNGNWDIYMCTLK